MRSAQARVENRRTDPLAKEASLQSEPRPDRPRSEPPGAPGQRAGREHQRRDQAAPATAFGGLAARAHRPSCGSSQPSLNRPPGAFRHRRPADPRRCDSSAPLCRCGDRAAPRRLARSSGLAPAPDRPASRSARARSPRCTAPDGLDACAPVLGRRIVIGPDRLLVTLHTDHLPRVPAFASPGAVVSRAPPRARRSRADRLALPPTSISSVA